MGQGTSAANRIDGTHILKLTSTILLEMDESIHLTATGSQAMAYLPSMEYRPYHTIIVTSWEQSLVKAVQRLAKRYFPRVGDIMVSEWNHLYTFIICPDGSKKGTEEDIKATKRRDLFWSIIEGRKYRRYQPLSVVELSYGRSEMDPKIIRYVPHKRDQL